MDIEVVEINRVVAVGLILNVGRAVIGVDWIYVVFVITRFLVVEWVFNMGFVVIVIIETSVVNCVFKLSVKVIVVDWPFILGWVVKGEAGVMVVVCASVEVLASNDAVVIIVVSGRVVTCLTVVTVLAVMVKVETLVVDVIAIIAVVVWVLIVFWLVDEANAVKMVVASSSIQ